MSDKQIGGMDAGFPTVDEISEAMADARLWRGSWAQMGEPERDVMRQGAEGVHLMLLKRTEQAYHARGAGRPMLYTLETADGAWIDGDNCVYSEPTEAQDDADSRNEDLDSAQHVRVVPLYRGEPGADTGTTPPLLTKQQREELVRAAHTLGDFTLETDHRAQELILLVESYMATAAERGTTPPEGRLSEIRQSIHINGDGTAALKTKDLSWMLNELELWPRRAATQRAPVEQGRIPTITISHGALPGVGPGPAAYLAAPDHAREGALRKLRDAPLAKFLERGYHYNSQDDRNEAMGMGRDLANGIFDAVERALADGKEGGE